MLTELFLTNTPQLVDPWCCCWFWNMYLCWFVLVALTLVAPSKHVGRFSLLQCCSRDCDVVVRCCCVTHKSKSMKIVATNFQLIDIPLSHAHTATSMIFVSFFSLTISLRGMPSVAYHATKSQCDRHPWLPMTTTTPTVPFFWRWWLGGSWCNTTQWIHAATLCLQNDKRTDLNIFEHLDETRMLSSTTIKTSQAKLIAAFVLITTMDLRNKNGEACDAHWIRYWTRAGLPFVLSHIFDNGKLRFCGWLPRKQSTLPFLTKSHRPALHQQHFPKRCKWWLKATQLVFIPHLVWALFPVQSKQQYYGLIERGVYATNKLMKTNIDAEGCMCMSTKYLRLCTCNYIMELPPTAVAVRCLDSIRYVCILAWLRFIGRSFHKRLVLMVQERDVWSSGWRHPISVTCHRHLDHLHRTSRSSPWYYMMMTMEQTSCTVPQL